MARISKEEQSELQRLSGLEGLREDFRRIKNIKRVPAEGGGSSVDAYLRFLAVANSFASHARKPFKKMIGNHFIL